MIQCGVDHTVLHNGDGELFAIGANYDRQCGGETSQIGNVLDSLYRIPCPRRIVSFSVGEYHTVAADELGEVWGCGRNKHHQLGALERQDSALFRIDGLQDIVKVYCGAYCTICVDKQDIILGFGSNADGVLGLGEEQAVFQTPTRICIPLDTDDTVNDIACLYSTLFLTANGKIFCCGRNKNGSLGLGDLNDRYFPILHPTLQDISAVALGKYHSLVLNSKGELWGFGSNEADQFALDNGRDSVFTEPFLIPNVPDSIAEISCGYRHSMIIDADRNLWTAGNSTYSQLGHSKASVHFCKVECKHVEYTSKRGYHVIVKCTNDVWSFGYNSYNQIGSPEMLENVVMQHFEVKLPTRMKDEYYPYFASTKRFSKAKSARK